MSIKEIVEKVKANEPTLFIALLVLLVSLAAYGLGRWSRLEDRREPVRIEDTAPEIINS